MDVPTDPHPLAPVTEASFRALARRGLLAEPSDAVFDPRSGQAWGPSDWDLNPEPVSYTHLTLPTNREV